MSPGAHDYTIPAELENTCALEAIHLLGTVQSHGFLMVVDLASRCIVQVSAGIVRHWPGLQDAAALLARPLSDWVATVEEGEALDLAALPASHLVALAWRPRFEQTCQAAGQSTDLHWECLGHRWKELALLEWLPANGNGDEQRRQN